MFFVSVNMKLLIYVFSYLGKELVSSEEDVMLEERAVSTVVLS